MNRTQLKQQQYKNKYVVHHIHLKLGNQVYTIEHDGAVGDFEKILAQMNKIYCDAILMQKEHDND